ncbi:MAG: 50S ribosomal protein L5 [Thermoprotei archaeon]|jgi:large subunit ribosomal protein L5
MSSQVNPMNKVRLGAVTVNIAVGESGERLLKAAKVLEELVGQKPALRSAKKTIKGFGIKKGEPIACIVTLRGQRAREFLDKALNAINRKIPFSSFSKTGVFSFGIKEHIEIPGAKYNPALGIFGMDICVTLEKPGYRVSRRKRATSKIGKKQRVTPEEAASFMKENFSVEVI